MPRFTCTSCKAWKKCKGPICHTRVGDGPVDLLIVGESPGVEEENVAVPFIGRSGQLLRRTLENITDNYILTNSRCCFGEKKPTALELKSCRKNWAKLIGRFQPKVVVCLGQYSAKTILGLKRLKMKNVIGVASYANISERIKCQVIVNYHPAYMLRAYESSGYSLIEDGWADTWDLVDQHIKGKVPELPEVRIILEPDEIIAYLALFRKDHDGDYSYDYETWGDVDALRPELNNQFKTLCVGMSTEIETVAFPLEHPECATPTSKGDWGRVLSCWEDFIMSSYGEAIGQNSKYEHKCNIVKFGQSRKMGDTMLQMNLIDENCEANLGAIAKYCELEWAFYKRQMAGIQTDPLSVELEETLLYCGLDALTTFTCYKKQRTKIEEQGLVDVLEMAENMAYHLAFVEVTGMAINGGVIAKLSPELERDAELISKKIQKYASIKNVIEWAMDNIKSWKGEAKAFNPRSPVQVKQLCLEELELPVNPHYDGSYDLGKEVLGKFENKHPVLKEILKFRSVKSILSNFVAKWHLFTGPDNCIHTVYTQDITATGRLSSKQMNLQNMPKAHPVRKSIHSRYKNGLLVAADYVQVEPMILAGMSDDKNMKKAFAEMLDLHLYTAAQIYNLDYDELKAAYDSGDKEAIKKRFHGKQMNLGMGYGITKYGLSDYTGVSINKAEAMIEKYNTSFPDVYEFRLNLHWQAMNNGYVCDLFGRRRHLPGAKSSNRGTQNRALRQAGNFPGQSTANYFCLISLCILRELIKERNIRMVIIGAEHDKLYLDIDREWQSEALETTQEAMLVHNEMEYWEPTGIDLRVDVQGGKNLYEMEEILV